MVPNSTGAMQKPGAVPLGGMSGQAQRNLQSLPYRRHVQEAQAMGQQPMSPEQFAQQSGG